VEKEYRISEKLFALLWANYRCPFSCSTFLLDHLMERLLRDHGNGQPQYDACVQPVQYGREEMRADGHLRGHQKEERGYEGIVTP
jgi:hypothetical protein